MELGSVSGVCETEPTHSIGSDYGLFHLTVMVMVAVWLPTFTFTLAVPVWTP